MEWTDRAIVLSGRKHGETSVILEVLTVERGRRKGLVRGGTGRRFSGVLQPGNELDVTWRARLAEHLGAFQVELRAARAADLIADPMRLAVAAAAFALVSLGLPEHEPHRAMFEGLSALLDGLTANGGHAEASAAAYIAWEVELLRELGFGLDLRRCALTGATEGLSYVSPKSGRAVTKEAAGRYHERLLVLPAFLVDGRAGITREALRAGFALTGHFLETHMLAPQDRAQPPARARLVERVCR